MSIFRYLILTSACVCALVPAVRETALEAKARSDFERVAGTTTPRPEDTSTCVQSQAELMPIARPELRSLVHYRKGYCWLVSAGFSSEPGSFRDAASELDLAISEWTPKEPAPVPPIFRMLTAFARVAEAGRQGSLSASAGDLQNFLLDVDCATFPPAYGAFCPEVVKAAYVWLAWSAGERGAPQEAAHLVQRAPASPWKPWLEARAAALRQDWPEAVRLEREAIEWWTGSAARVPGLISILAPRPDLARAWYELAASQWRTSDYRGVIQSLDRSLTLDPRNAPALFLRARAREMSGAAPGATQDFELAARTAYTGDEASSALGHLYQGVALFRRKEYGQAESEFAIAVSAGPDESARADATAWWRMAAVAQGACGASIEYLERSLASVSAFFPKQEARQWITRCRATAPSAGA
jgi:tetratricopeptide (TPR) repeat protein